MSSDAYAKLPLLFEANRGQTDPQVRFLSRAPGATVFLTSTEAVLALRTPRSVVRMRLVGANAEPSVVGSEPTPTKVNYFIGNGDESRRAQVPTYAKVHYQAVYPGIDLIYYGRQRQLEYDFVVAPGADPSSITLSFDGVDRVDIDVQGDLVLNVAGGQLRQRRPLVYQEADGVRVPIVSGYVLKENNEVGFRVAAYDRTRHLIIDPIVYTTYLGGSATEEAFGIAADSAGSAYVTGYTESVDFPTAGTGQSVSGGKRDAFVVKLTPDGSAAVYATYLGGTEDDAGHSIAVDSAGNAYIAGMTSSADFPTTVGALQRTYGGGLSDAFVAVLEPSGSLAYSTFLGGTGTDQAAGLAIDRDANAGSARHIFVTGATASFGSFPITGSAVQPQPGGGPFDAFVVKLDISASTVLYSTYLGGAGQDYSSGIAIDTAGSAYVTGGTTSSDFPTVNSFRTTGGGFVAKLAPDGSTLIYSTLLGPFGPASGSGIAVDGAGNAYVVGNQQLEPPYTQCNTLDTDAFIGKLTAAGALASWSCFGLGTNSNIALDRAGNVVVAGFKRNPFDPWDSPPYLFVSTAGEEVGLAESWYLNLHLAIAVDAADTVYVAGATSGEHPATAGAMQTNIAGGADAFVTKIAAPPITPPSSEPLTVVLTSPDGHGVLTSTFNVGWTHSGGTPPVTVTVKATSLDGLVWATPLGTQSPALTPGSMTLNPRNMMQGRQLLVLTASAPGTASAQVTREITVWYADEEPPTTSIASAVDGNGASVPSSGATVSNSLTLTVSGSDNVMVAGFECRMDAAAFTSCGNSVTYSSLGLGRHDFEVRAVDTAGNRDATPAQHTVTVDATPNTTITSAVDRNGRPIPNGGKTTSTSVTFRFGGSDNVSVASFQCSIDGSAFSSCTSPIMYTRDARGTHSFKVRAIDSNGFQDPTPAVFTWRK